ncbi:hypothetical protein NJT12_16615, partial [Flavobacterium sp. AC]
LIAIAHNFSKWIAKIRLGNFNLIFDLVEALEKFIEDPILAQIYIFQETLCKSTSIIKERGRLFRQPLLLKFYWSQITANSCSTLVMRKK